jgi:hypothetical protein
MEQGCIDPRSIVEYEDGCFFMSDRGFMYFDGSQLINTTQGVLRSSLVEAALAAVGDDGTDGGYVTASCLPNGYIERERRDGAFSLDLGQRPHHHVGGHVPRGPARVVNALLRVPAERERRRPICSGAR